MTVTEENAVSHLPEKPVDIVIENPPFGTVKGEDGKTAVHNVDGFETREIDQAIVARSLKTLKPGGKAVLIIGGKQSKSLEARQADYRSAGQVNFYQHLFDNYHVLDHFTVDGKLYARQGASYPVDMIVLEKKGTTAELGDRKFPGLTPPRIYDNYQGLEELLNEQVDQGGNLPAMPVEAYSDQTEPKDMSQLTNEMEVFLLGLFRKKIDPERTESENLKRLTTAARKMPAIL